MKNEAHQFVKDLREAGLEVREKVGSGGHKNGYVIYAPSGQMLGAFGNNVGKGRTKQNILAQIRRATGIRVSP